MATSFYLRYPSAGGASANPSVGTTGVTAPTSATEVGFIDQAGNLQPFSGTSSTTGPNVNVTNFPTTQPVSGTVTSNQGTPAVTANAWPIKNTDGTNVAAVKAASTAPAATDPALVVSLSPNGAQSTSALQTSGNASLATIATNTGLAQGSTTSGQSGNLQLGAVTTAAPTYTTAQSSAFSLTTAGALRVDASASTQPISGTVTANQGTGGASAWKVDGSAVTQPISATALPLPTGAATATLQSSVIGTVAAGTAATSSELVGGVFNTTLPTLTNGQQSAVQFDNRGRQIISPTSGIPIIGTAFANAPVINQYGTTSITTGAYVQLIASTTSVTNSVHVFDSSGQAMILGVGGAGSEVVQYYVQPGGDTFNLTIPAGSRVAYKALTANATSGYLLVNLLQ